MLQHIKSAVKQLQANTFLFPFADINLDGGYRNQHLVTTVDHDSSMKENDTEENQNLNITFFVFFIISYYYYIVAQTVPSRSDQLFILFLSLNQQAVR